MKRKSRKRSRKEYETDTTNEELIDAALSEIYANDEVLEPTKKKVRLALQSKLNASKSFIKQHKPLIHSLIHKYWIAPPKMPHTNGHDMDNEDTKHEAQFLSIPDHIQLYVFSMLHPKSIYVSLPSVCKWWHHLLHKETFLHSLCTDVLKLRPQQTPTPLRLHKLVPFMKVSCLSCSVCSDSYDNTEDLDFISWVQPLCRSCFAFSPALQGISWMRARKKYRLNDMDLYCCKAIPMGITYCLHSDVIEVAKDKYGDISKIEDVSALEVAEINTERRSCYDKLCNALKKELKAWLDEEEKKPHDIRLDEQVLEWELTEFLSVYHSGYSIFRGTHCEEIMQELDRTFMHLILNKCEIKARLKEHMDKVRKRKNGIRNMTDAEIYSEMYASSWMNATYGNYI